MQRGGDYNFCISSDDGSMFYIAPGPAPAAGEGVKYRLLVDDDGLHGPQQRCRTLPLAAGGRFPVKITGFQAAGGVYMQTLYSGPDTGGTLVPLPSADSEVPVAAASADGWTMQVRRACAASRRPPHHASLAPFPSTSFPPSLSRSRCGAGPPCAADLPGAGRRVGDARDLRPQRPRRREQVRCAAREQQQHQQ